MKDIILSIGIIKKSFFSYIVLISISLLAVYHAVMSLGYMEYKYYGIGVAEKYLQNADYVMRNGITYDFDEYEELKKKIEAYEGVKCVLYRIQGNIVLSNNKEGNGESIEALVLMYSEGYGEYYSENIAEGGWKNSANNKYQCVTNIRDVKKGETYYMFPTLPDNMSELNVVGEVRVSGKFYHGGSFLDVSTSSNKLSVEDCYDYYDNVVVMPYNEEFLDSVKAYLYSASTNYYILYEDGISDSQKDYIREQVIGDDYYFSVSEAIEYSKEGQRETTIARMLLPTLLIYLSSMMFVVVAVIFSYKYMNEFSIYYLVGSTRRRILKIVNISLVPIVFIVLAYSAILIGNYENMESFQFDSFLNIGYVMYGHFLIYITFYIVILFLLSNVIVGAIIYNMTPMKFYRQFGN